MKPVDNKMRNTRTRETQRERERQTTAVQRTTRVERRRRDGTPTRIWPHYGLTSSELTLCRIRPYSLTTSPQRSCSFDEVLASGSPLPAAPYALA